jgi:tetratricopeptide (TPR) repeat protein
MRNGWKQLVMLFITMIYWPEAIECYRLSLEMKEKCTPINYREVVKTLKILARFYKEKHEDVDYISARMYYEKALVIIHETMSDPSNYASVLNAIGNIHENTSRYSLALEYYEKAFNILFVLNSSIQSEDADDELDLETVGTNIVRIECLIK